MSETLRLTASESVTLRARDADVLEVEAEYGTGGSPPPKHFHPEQDERFTVLEGSLATRVDGAERRLEPGDELEVPRGTVHQMWNPGSEPATVRWETRPQGRTEQWFRELDALQRSSGGRPSPLAFGVLLVEYDDVFRLAGPAVVLRPAAAGLGLLGRARGHRTGYA